MNDTLFMPVCSGFYVLPFGNTGELAARIFVLALVAGLILWFIRRPFSDRADFYRKCLYTVAALFLLSPTQFPWYYIWVLALLALSPRKSLLFLLTPLLSLYYLRFYFETRNMAYIFDNWIVWLEYLPVWVLLVRELFKKNDLEENSQHSVKTSP